MENLKEICDKLLHHGMNVRLPKVYQLSSAEDCLNAVQDLPSTEEGYVVRCNTTGNRVKIKSPAYVALHRLRGNGAPTFNNIAELVLLNEHEEYLTVFEGERFLFQPVVDALERMMEQMTLAYDEFRDVESQKDFAMAVKDLSFSGVLFKARKCGGNVIHAFNEVTMTQKITLLKEFILVMNND